MNVLDHVNVTTRSKTIEEQVFADKQKMFLTRREERLKKSMVETIHQIQKTHTKIEGPSTSMEGWNTTWLGMPNTTFVEAHKYHEVVNSQEKLIIIN